MMSPRHKELIDQLRIAREARGMSQRAASAAAGLGRDTVWQIEQGNRSPSLDTLLAIAAAVGRDIAVVVRVPS